MSRLIAAGGLHSSCSVSLGAGETAIPARPDRRSSACRGSTNSVSGPLRLLPFGPELVVQPPDVPPRPAELGRASLRFRTSAGACRPGEAPVVTARREIPPGAPWRSQRAGRGLRPTPLSSAGRRCRRTGSSRSRRPRIPRERARGCRMRICPAGRPVRAYCPTSSTRGTRWKPRSSRSRTRPWKRRSSPVRNVTRSSSSDEGMGARLLQSAERRHQQAGPPAQQGLCGLDPQPSDLQVKLARLVRKRFALRE